MIGGRFLLVLCHGHGADAGQMQGLAAALQERVRGAELLLPDAPYRVRRYLLRQPGRRWFPLGAQQARQRRIVTAAAKLLNGWIDAALAARGLKQDELVLGGFSQGAMVTLLAGLARPVQPRGIIALAGALMQKPGPVQAAGRPPVLLVHGDADPVVPHVRSVEAAGRLEAAGIPAQLVTLRGAGHMIVEAGTPAAADFLAKLAA